MKLWAVVIVHVTCASVISAVHAKEPEKAAAPQPEAASQVPVARDYCSSFVDAAAERRISRLNADLQRTKDEVSAEIEVLKEKSAELRALLDERKAIQEKVGESLLKIYLQVEPEAAAQQLSKLEPATAAEILLRMNAKKSGEILTLMEPKRAASLVARLTLQTRPQGDENQ